MTIDFRYTQNRLEKPSRCSFAPDFRAKRAEHECSCTPQPDFRQKRKLISLPWGKRYFGFEKCAPDPYLPARASTPTELRRFYTQPRCCKK